MDFDESGDGNRRLRAAIDYLYANRRGLSSARLLAQAEAYYKELHTRGKVPSVPNLPSPSTVTRFRTEVHYQLRSGAAGALWDFIADAYPRALGMEEQTDSSFINALFWYYGVDWRSHGTLAGEIEDSTFLVYHFSEILAESSADAVVVGEITVRRQAARLLHIAERQSYDGSLGLSASTESNEGYAFPKFQSVCMLLRGPKQAPKIYVFHRSGHDGGEEAAKISWMRGRMARITPAGPLFVSNAYAVRVPSDHGKALNIYPSSDPEIGAAILDELRRTS